MRAPRGRSSKKGLPLTPPVRYRVLFRGSGETNLNYGLLHVCTQKMSRQQHTRKAVGLLSERRPQIVILSPTFALRNLILFINVRQPR